MCYPVGYFSENYFFSFFARRPGLDIMRRTSETSCPSSAQGDSDAGTGTL